MERQGFYFVLISSIILLSISIFVTAYPDCSPGFWQGDGGYCECPAGYKEYYSGAYGSNACVKDDSQQSASECYAACQNSQIICLDTRDESVCGTEAQACIAKCVSQSTGIPESTQQTQCPSGYHLDKGICCEENYKAADNGLACVYSGEKTTPTPTSPTPPPSIQDTQTSIPVKTSAPETKPTTPPQKTVPSTKTTLPPQNKVPSKPSEEESEPKKGDSNGEKDSTKKPGDKVDKEDLKKSIEEGAGLLAGATSSIADGLAEAHEAVGGAEISGLTKTSQAAKGAGRLLTIKDLKEDFDKIDQSQISPAMKTGVKGLIVGTAAYEEALIIAYPLAIGRKAMIKVVELEGAIEKESRESGKPSRAAHAKIIGASIDAGEKETADGENMDLVDLSDGSSGYKSQTTGKIYKIEGENRGFSGFFGFKTDVVKVMKNGEWVEMKAE